MELHFSFGAGSFQRAKSGDDATRDNPFWIHFLKAENCPKLCGGRFGHFWGLWKSESFKANRKPEEHAINSKKLKASTRKRAILSKKHPKH